MSDPLLTEIQIATYKDTAVGDPTPVPTAATIEFYRAGATVSTATTVPATVLEFTIDVHESSRLAIGDQLIAGPDGAALEVDGIPSATSITVTNNGAAVPLAAGSRLIVTNGRPRLYSRRGGPPLASSSLSTDAVNGRATAYLAADRFDYTTQVTGQAKRLYVDAPGGDSPAMSSGTTCGTSPASRRRSMPCPPPAVSSTSRLAPTRSPRAS